MASRYITTPSSITSLLSFACALLTCAIISTWPSFAIAQEQVIDAEGMTIYGQRELPKVMYIVPWKKTKSAEIDMPMTESLVSDVLDPIDPEVFRRKIKYFELMNDSK